MAVEWLPLHNAGSTTFCVPARHAESIRRSGPWYSIGERVATITARNGGEARLLSLHDLLEYLDGRSGRPEPRTEDLPTGIEISTAFH